MKTETIDLKRFIKKPPLSWGEIDEYIKQLPTLFDSDISLIPTILPQISLSFLGILKEYKDMYLPLLGWYEIKNQKIKAYEIEYFHCSLIPTILPRSTGGWTKWRPKTGEIDCLRYSNLPIGNQGEPIELKLQFMDLKGKLLSRREYAYEGPNGYHFQRNGHITRRKELKFAQKCSTYFDGLLPQTTREKYWKLAPVFDEMAIVKEIRKWNVKEILAPKPTDPLLIGWSKRYSKAFLVDQFNTTGAEDFIVAKYSEDK